MEWGRVHFLTVFIYVHLWLYLVFDMTVEERLVQLFPTAKRTTLKRMLQTGRVRLVVGGEKEGVVVRRFAEVVPEGREVVVLAQAPEPARHRKGDLPVVYEDDDLLVVNKPPGLLTATVPGERRPTLLAKVEAYMERTSPRARAGLIHRLDKDARGLLVFSKHGAAFASLKAQLKDRVMEREYHAVVVGRIKPAAGRIESLLEENEVEGTVASTTNKRRGEEAITHYETLRAFGGSPGKTAASLLKVKLETGRKHQIRVHLSEKGAAIMGDVMYGKPPHNKPPLLLAATRLGVIHPATGKTMAWETEVPAEFWAAVGKDVGTVNERR